MRRVRVRPGRFEAAAEASRATVRWPIGHILGAMVAFASLLAFATATGAGVSGVRTQMPDRADGLAVVSVSELLDQRAHGGLRGSDAAVSGFWSDRSIAHSCTTPDYVPGDLEIRCHDGEFGITQLEEPILSIGDSGQAVAAAGPHLTPWFPPDVVGLSELFSLPVINGQRYPPVPIVAIGHFDDERALSCAGEVRPVCFNRFVVSKIVALDVHGVATPEPTPAPTEFPSPAPHGLFDPRAPDVCAGDVAYSFVGWSTTDELGLPFHREGHVWAATTKEAVLLGGDDWTVDESIADSPFRMWGRRICVAEERHPNVILSGVVPGTQFMELPDGTTVSVASP